MKGLRNHVSKHVLRSAGRPSAVGQAVPDVFVAPSMHRDHPNEGSLRLSVLWGSPGSHERIRQAQPDLPWIIERTRNARLALGTVKKRGGNPRFGVDKPFGITAGGGHASSGLRL